MKASVLLIKIFWIKTSIQSITAYIFWVRLFSRTQTFAIGENTCNINVSESNDDQYTQA